MFERMVKQTGTEIDRQLGQTDRSVIHIQKQTDKLLDRFVRQTGTGPETDRQVFLLITAVIIELV